MAVTLVIDDLQQPIGELSTELFPTGNLGELLDGWLTQATNKVDADTGIATADQNTAATAWVYYRAYSYKANMQASTPNQVNFSNQPGVSKTMSVDQREYFVNLASTKLAEYEGFAAASSTVSTAPAYFGRVSARRGYGYNG